MSSGFKFADNLGNYVWANDLDPDQYITATYYVETNHAIETATRAMAREQSTVASHHVDIPGFLPDDYAARVVSITSVGSGSDELMRQFQFHETSDRSNSSTHDKIEFEAYSVEIAYPLLIVPATLTGVFSVALGEMPRLGFLNAVRLTDIVFPTGFISKFKGPKFGVAGLRERLGIADRPLFCRATRPALGLSSSMMSKIGENVLRGGFDILKDDEMTLSLDIDDYRNRIKTLCEMVTKVANETNERKLMVANLIEDNHILPERLAVLGEFEVEAILVAPALQGQSIITQIRDLDRYIILAHNTGGDVWTRLDRFGVDLPVILKLHRLGGADIVLLSGDFATEACDANWMKRCVEACSGKLGEIEPAMPVIAGGKQSRCLQNYIDAIGSTDFMVIAATAVDDHPDGTEVGAREFRTAWSNIQPNIQAR